MDIPTEYIKNLAFNSLITCIYLPVIICVLNFNGNLYSIGKETTNVEYILALAEVLKYLRIYLLQKNPKRKLSLKFLLKLSISCFGSVIVFYIGAVLFGAPVLSQQYETLFFAILMTILTALPICLFLEPDCVFDLFTSLTYFEGTRDQEYFLLNTRLTVFGAWLGAVVIPLDWDRPYQDWPIPCCYGALAGYFLANLVTLFFYKSSFPLEKKRKYYI